MIWRGEVYDVDLGSPIGHEPGSTRPATVVSADILNNGPGRLIMIAPITSAFYGLRSHIELDPGVSGLSHVSYARCDQLRVVSAQRLLGRRGKVESGAMAAIDRALPFVLDL